jgi:opacity protein-like surface antigen
MYKIFKKKAILIALGIIGLSTAYAGSWDEDNAPPAGSVVSADGGPAPHSGFYVGIEGGGTWLNDQDYGQGVTLESNPGYNGGITFGYDYKWFRIEEELNAARNSADNLSIIGSPARVVSALTGRAFNKATILNLDGNTTSYNFAGVGVGGSAIDYNYRLAHSVDGIDNNSTSTWKGAFTAQALGGISYTFNPRVELDLEYRFVNAFVIDGDLGDGNSIPDYRTNNVDLGLKFFFT